MKTKILFILLLCYLCHYQKIHAQVPVPEDYFDLYDTESNDEENQEQNTNNLNLNEIQQLLDATGAVGALPSSAINSFKMVNNNCERTYICLYNTLVKLIKIAEYEHALKSKELGCEDRKVILQDYAMYLLTLNLDLYCVEHLHPDNNELEDVELINAMLAMRDFYFDFIERDYDYGKENLPMLFSYRQIRTIADPNCSKDLYEIDDNTGDIPCDCGEFSGILDTAEKNKLLQDIRTIIDDINPMWQTAKALEINQNLKALPCQD